MLKVDRDRALVVGVVYQPLAFGNGLPQQSRPAGAFVLAFGMCDRVQAGQHQEHQRYLRANEPSGCRLATLIAAIFLC
ncbi:hypothetical protein [Bradyrhizobium oligotrophicum]|uniref:hypothetical protein n=1 Tax=Bradyrhizobium oligotrophicum TaxID=44255 RepID=UPI003EC1513A